MLEATTPEQIWLADLDAIEQLLDERDKALGFDEKRSSSKTKINTTVAKNKYAKRKLDEDEVCSNAVFSFFSYRRLITITLLFRCLEVEFQRVRRI